MNNYCRENVHPSDHCFVDNCDDCYYLGKINELEKAQFADSWIIIGLLAYAYPLSFKTVSPYEVSDNAEKMKEFVRWIMKKV